MNGTTRWTNDYKIIDTTACRILAEWTTFHITRNGQEMAHIAAIYHNPSEQTLETPFTKGNLLSCKMYIT